MTHEKPGLGEPTLRDEAKKEKLIKKLLPHFVESVGPTVRRLFNSKLAEIESRRKPQLGNSDPTPQQ